MERSSSKYYFVAKQTKLFVLKAHIVSKIEKSDFLKNQIANSAFKWICNKSWNPLSFLHIG